VPENVGHTGNSREPVPRLALEHEIDEEEAEEHALPLRPHWHSRLSVARGRGYGWFEGGERLCAHAGRESSCFHTNLQSSADKRTHWHSAHQTRRIYRALDRRLGGQGARIPCPDLAVRAQYSRDEMSHHSRAYRGCRRNEDEYETPHEWTCKSRSGLLD